VTANSLHLYVLALIYIHNMVLFEVNYFKNTPKNKIKKHHKWIEKTLSVT